MSAFRLFLLSVVVAAGLIAVLAWPSANPDLKGARLDLYCAAGLRKPVSAVVAEYRAKHGVEVAVHYAGSGDLLSEIQVRKKGDLYLAADASYVDQLARTDLVRERFPVARQRIVVAVRAGNPKSIRGLDDLLREDVAVALANPDQASVGKQVRRILGALGRWDALAARAKVFKPTVNLIANDVALGAVDCALVWDSTAAVYADQNLEAVRLPEFETEVFHVTLSVLATSEAPTAALHFARFLTASDCGAKSLADLGFDAVAGDVWAERPQLVVWSGGVNRVAIEKTVKEFGQREGVDVLTTFNGCGILVGGMAPLVGKDGFPDVYFACDQSFLDSVSGLYFGSTLVSETDMVIVVPRGNPRAVKGLEDLARDGMRLGFADPQKSALGALTVRLLDGLGLRERVWRNVVTTDATADTLVAKALVSQGETLDAVIVYRANCSLVKGQVEVLTIDHPLARAEQPIAIARQSPRRALAERFVAALLTPLSASRFEDAGFRVRFEPSKGAE